MSGKSWNDEDWATDDSWAMETLRLNGEGDHIPPLLHKYLSTDSRYFQLTMHELLLHNRIRLSSRTEFNDPFDAAVALSYVSDDELTDWIETAIARHSREGDRESLVRYVRSDPKEFQRASIDAYRGTLARVGIYSLSAVRDNPLMWAHYAASYRGVVVSFGHYNPTFGAALPVRYQNQFPRMAMRNADGYEMCVAIKGRAWAYEKEWRIVVPNGARTWHNIPAASVRSVTCGPLCSDEDRNTVSELVDRRLAAGMPPVDIYDVHLPEDRFGMEFWPFRRFTGYTAAHYQAPKLSRLHAVRGASLWKT